MAATTQALRPGWSCVVGFPRQPGIFGNERGDGRGIALLDLLVEQLVELAVLAHAERIGVMLGAVVLGGAGVDELAAALGQIGQPLLPGRGREGGQRFKGAAIVAQDGGIDGTSLGAPALGPGVVADAGGLDDVDGDFVACSARTTGCSWCRRWLPQQTRAPGWPARSLRSWVWPVASIGQDELVREMQLQRELGNIEADAGGDNGIVLTHTCKNPSPGDQWSPCSSQRFEFRTKGTRETRSETHHALAYARRGRFRAAPSPSKPVAEGDLIFPLSACSCAATMEKQHTRRGLSHSLRYFSFPSLLGG